MYGGGAMLGRWLDPYLGWIKFLETIASHGAWSGWVETLAKSP